MANPSGRSSTGNGGDAPRRARELLSRLGAAEVSDPLVRELSASLAAVVDHAERVESEQESLRQQQAALRTVISSVPFFVFWKDREGVFRGCNDSFAEVFGLRSPNEIVGKTDYDLPVTKEHADLYREADLAVVRSGEPKLDMEEATVDADGNERFLLTSKVPLQAEDGSVIGVLGIFADITARKQLEKDLERARQLAEAANHAKGDFLAAMSHELRTPLTLILSPLESLLRGTGPLPPAVQQVLAQVYRNAARLKTLTDEILDYSKHEAGHLRLRPEVVSLSEHVARLASDMQPAAAAAGLQLRLEGIAPNLGAVRVDAAKLDKILTNLVGNALKFTPPGGEVSVSLAVVGRELRLAVTDTGIGIEPAQQPRLFRRFEQLDGSSKRRHGGTGLGLSLVKAFAELMGGGVDVESAPGKGSTFRVSLPYEPTPEPIAPREVLPNALLPTRPTVSAEATRTHFDDADARPRVLVADDNEELRGWVAELLTPHFQVMSVGDGAAALRAVARAEPDVVVSDVMMPEMDGFELVRRLKADTELRRIPILLLTARAGADAAAESLEQGADDYLAKPFSAVDLVARVRAACRTKRLNAELLEAERRLATTERLAGLGRLLAKLSHELNNPVNVIYNGVLPLEEYCGTLVRYTEACDQAAAARGDASLAPLREALDLPFILKDLPDAMRAVRDSAMRVRDVQSNFMLFLQGRRSLNLVPGELGPLVASTLELTRRTTHGKLSAELFMEDIPPFEFDAGRLGQALLNLLKNAAESAGPTGLVRVETSCTAKHACIAVSDTGPGVPAAIRHRLFEPFFTTKDVGVGTGLGLSISLEIVGQHGGRLFLDEGYREGARFVIELPLVASSEAPLPLPPNPRAVSREVTA